MSNDVTVDLIRALAEHMKGARDDWADRPAERARPPFRVRGRLRWLPTTPQSGYAEPRITP